MTHRAVDSQASQDIRTAIAAASRVIDRAAATRVGPLGLPSPSPPPGSVTKSLITQEPEAGMCLRHQRPLRVVRLTYCASCRAEIAGSARSAKKRAAARRNGKLGGPRTWKTRP